MGNPGYLVLAGIAVFGYLFLYGATVDSGKQKSISQEREGVYVGDKFKDTRKRPKFAKGKVANLAQQALFAPAFMTDTLVRSSKWGVTRKIISQRDTTHLEVIDGGKELLDRKKKGR